jgi:glucose-1-phosphate thymidylyltransferase
MRGLILAGGHGTRLRPLTSTGNKHMLPVANQPILYYGLRHLAAAGIREVGLVLGPIQEGIREGVGDGRQFGLSITYVEQPDPLGLADAVLRAREFLGDEPFVMYLGDNLLQSGVAPFVRTWEADRPDAVIGVTRVAHPERYGVVEWTDGRIRSIEEKPAHPRSDLALVGVYLFSPEVHAVVQKLRPSARGELEITDAIRGLWSDRGRVSVLPVEGWWKDTGHPEDLLEANHLVLGSLPTAAFNGAGVWEDGSVREGTVGTGTGTRISAGAKVTGPTLLGDRVHIGPGSEVGPDCAIGPDVQIVRSSVRRSIVMAGSRIEGVRIVDSIIGRNAVIRAETPGDREVRLTLGDSSQTLL